MDLKAFTDEQEAEIARLYDQGETAIELARRFYCCRETVMRILRRKSRKLVTAQRRRKNAQMIVHDWNVGIPISQIVRTYGFESRMKLYHFAKSLRSKGWKLKNRHTGRKSMSKYRTAGHSPNIHIEERQVVFGRPVYSRLLDENNEPLTFSSNYAAKNHITKLEREDVEKSYRTDLKPPENLINPGYGITGDENT